jgi:hypothetical protein
VDENMEEFDRVGARAKAVTDIDDVDDLAKDLGYHFCCNVGLESYSPEKKYTETKYDINDLRFNNVITMNKWKVSQLQIGGFPTLDVGKAIETIRKEVVGNYSELVNKAVTIVGFEDLNAEFETYYIDSTDIHTGSNNYFANNILVCNDKGPQNNEQEHR